MVKLIAMWDNPLIMDNDYLKKKGSVYTMNIIDKITQSQMKKDLPEFRVGDSVTVGCIITETKGGKSKERVQDFKGTVIARKGKGVSETFTVRGEYSGIGVEKTFHVHSNKVAYIKVTKPGKVRRAKLYFLRDRQKKYNIKERRYYLFIIEVKDEKNY